MRDRTKLVLFVAVAWVLCGLGVAAGLCLAGGGGQAGSPRTVDGLTVSPDGRYVAFSVLGDMDVPVPVQVIDSSGVVVCRTASPARPASVDFPLGWLPTGEALLCQRVRPGADPRAEARRDIFLLHPEQGTQETVVPASAGCTAAYPVDAETIICRLCDAAGPNSPGLYIVRKTEGRWETKCLLRDTARRAWQTCVWGLRKEGESQLIVEAAEPRSQDGGVITFWSVVVGRDRPIPAQLIAAPGGRVYRSAVSRDGSRLALIAGRDGRTCEVLLFYTGEATRPPEHLQVPANVRFVSFAPTGGKLLLWDIGWRDPSWRMPWALMVADTATLEVADVAIPSSIGNIWSADWLSDDVLAVGVAQYGVVSLDLRTGEVADLWVMPPRTSSGGSEPRAPSGSFLSY